jgi:hypothetical protein
VNYAALDIPRNESFSLFHQHYVALSFLN